MKIAPFSHPLTCAGGAVSLGGSGPDVEKTSIEEAQTLQDIADWITAKQIPKESPLEQDAEDGTKHAVICAKQAQIIIEQSLFKCHQIPCKTYEYKTT